MDAVVKPVARAINRKQFFATVRTKLFGGKLNQLQCDGMEAILKEWELRKLTDLRHLAYMLATALHESAATMQPIEEWGKGAHYDYGKKLKQSRVPYSSPNKLYYGRGLVMITWFENYLKMGKLLGIDLINNPELACTMYVAVKIMFEGMLKAESSFGDFTGKSLEMYFNDTTEDWINARRIINGCRKGETIPDKAEQIAGAAKVFYKALAA